MTAEHQHPMQALVNAFNDADSATRAAYHMTLGALKVALDDAPKSLPVIFEDGCGVRSFQSYRGYYTDLSLTDGEPKTVAEMRRITDRALQTTFTGYKGGEYPARPGKPLWRANWGDVTDLAIVGFEVSAGAFLLKTKKVD